jgi:hypothetical protein
MAIGNKSASDFSFARTRDIKEQRVIDALNSFNIPDDFKAILYGNIKYESGNSFDINKLEVLEPGVTREKGVGLFQKTGKTKRSYDDYLQRNRLPNNEVNEIKYYLDAIADKDKIVAEYLGTGYMRDYRNMLTGKPSDKRGGKHGIVRRQYKPEFRDIHEHFVNFMMNPKQEARIKSLPNRLQFSIDARNNIFNSTLPEESIIPQGTLMQIPE